MNYKTYSFRDYLFHIPANLQVYIGNQETQLVIFNNTLEYDTLAYIKWIEERQTLQVETEWRSGIRYEIKGKTIVISEGEQLSNGL